jgi:2-octaprenyl-6-methoxyphenol hydroxylase
MNTDFDVVIIGGGLVGASLAVALGRLPLRVALVEAVAFESGAQPSYDDRSIALAFGSRRIFDGLGVWSRIEGRGATPIARIHISDRGRFGFARLSAADAGVEALGWVVESRALGQALRPALDAAANLTLFMPATMEDLAPGADRARVDIRHGDERRSLTARLVVAADGGRSAARTRLGIAIRTRDYGQSALITNVTPELPHANVAYERFTDTGPLALLPMSDNRCAVVWSAAPEQAEALKALGDDEFLARLEERFGGRLGRLRKVGRRAVYPLTRTDVAEIVRERLVLIGNAAHTVHPVAGQGFNLGLRDVAALAEVLDGALAAGEDIGSASALTRYADWRRRDTRTIAAFTDTLVGVFSNDLGPLALARNLGLIGIDLLPPAKRALLRLSMGLSGRLPRLARGLSV